MPGSSGNRICPGGWVVDLQWIFLGPLCSPPMNSTLCLPFSEYPCLRPILQLGLLDVRIADFGFSRMVGESGPRVLCTHHPRLELGRSHIVRPCNFAQILFNMSDMSIEMHFSMPDACLPHHTRNPGVVRRWQEGYVLIKLWNLKYFPDPQSSVLSVQSIVHSKGNIVAHKKVYSMYNNIPTLVCPRRMMTTHVLHFHNYASRGFFDAAVDVSPHLLSRVRKKDPDRYAYGMPRHPGVHRPRGDSVWILPRPGKGKTCWVAVRVSICFFFRSQTIEPVRFFLWLNKASIGAQNFFSDKVNARSNLEPRMKRKEVLTQ